MQLDYFLESTIEKFKLDYEVKVIYHTSGDHAHGYTKLRDKYRGLPINFLERSAKRRSRLTSRSKIRRRLQRVSVGSVAPSVRDDFKQLLEATLAETRCEFVMFNTDDGYWFQDFYLDDDVANLIRHNPTTVSYRTYVGDNLTGFPDFVRRWGHYYLWDYYSPGPTTHWTYPFSVDGTVYHTRTLLEILRPVDYYNPVSLEGLGVQQVITNGMLGLGLSPITSQLVCTKLNRVATETRNPTIHLDPGLLNEKFLQGYRLDLTLPPVNNANLVPQRVVLRRGHESLLLYEIDQLGEVVQANLDTGGAKKQMD